jgi:hypothetical protein
MEPQQMPRYLVATVTTLLTSLAIAAPASAKFIEIGRTKATATPSCTGAVGDVCQVVTRTTGVQMSVGKIKNPTLIAKPGRLVAFTVQLGKLTKSQIGFFTQTEYGPKANRKQGVGLGESSARLSVLRPAFKTKNNFRFKLVAQTEDFKLAPYFGRSATFAPAATIPVVKGDIVAVTTTTWAPILALNLPTDTTWRAARNVPCSNAEGETIPVHTQTRLQDVKQYFCNFRTARLLYTATEVVTP